MNVKSIASPLLTSVDARLKADVKTEMKSQDASDREADGRRQSDDDENPKRPMTNDEIEEVLESIRQLPGVQTHSLLVELSSEADHQVVWLKDAKGKVIRRLTLDQLWQIYKRPDKGKGQIFDRAM